MQVWDLAHSRGRGRQRSSGQGAEIDHVIEYHQHGNRGERQEWGNDRPLEDEHGVFPRAWLITWNSVAKAVSR